MGEFTIYQQDFDPTAKLCIGDMTFMDTSEGIKTDHSDMESIYIKLSNILKLCPFSLQRLQNVYIEEYTYSPTVFA